MSPMTWSKRSPFGRQTSPSSDQLGVRAGPQDVKPPPDAPSGRVAAAPAATPAAATSEHHQSRQEPKGGFIRNLLGRSQSKLRTSRGPNTTSATRRESNAG